MRKQERMAREMANLSGTIVILKDPKQAAPRWVGDKELTLGKPVAGPEDGEKKFLRIFTSVAHSDYLKLTQMRSPWSLRQNTNPRQSTGGVQNLPLVVFS